LYGKVIAALRKEKGLSQRELADIFKIAKSSVSMYELEKREPDIDIIIGMADFFDVSIDYLLGIQEEKGRLGRSIIVSDEKERDLLEKYRELDSDGKAELRGFIQGYIAQGNGSKHLKRMAT